MLIKLLKLPFKIIGYKLFRKHGWPQLKPLSIALSVTNKCNSKCKTCNIWKQNSKKELSSSEWKKILKSIGNQPLWFTITGGEPFLKENIDKIVEYLCRYNKPLFINIATNGLLPEKIYKKTKIIAKICERANTFLTINISIDGLYKKYDEIRGTKDGFKSVLESIHYLKKIQRQYKKLNIGANIVVSIFNQDNFIDIYKYIQKKLKPDSIVSEIATNREAFFLKNEKIMPSQKKYLKILNFLLKQKNGRNRVSKIITKLRRKYYKLIRDNLIKGKTMPCYAAIASCEILCDGNIINCCTQAIVLGELRTENYDFNEIWFSKKTQKIRGKIKKKDCFCALSNIFYTNKIINDGII